MKHRAVKCQWKLSSSLLLLLSIFLLLAVFAKGEPLTLLALLVFSEQAVFLLLPMFLTSPQNNTHFPRTEAYLNISKITSTFKLPHPSLTVDPQCSSGVCQNLVEAAVLIALLGDRAKLLLQLSGCTESGHSLHRGTQRKSPVQVSPGMDVDVPLTSWWAVLIAALIPGPLLFLSGWHPLQGLYLCHPCQGWCSTPTAGVMQVCARWVTGRDS